MPYAAHGKTVLQISQPGQRAYEQLMEDERHDSCYGRGQTTSPLTVDNIPQLNPQGSKMPRQHRPDVRIEQTHIHTSKNRQSGAMHVMVDDINHKPKKSARVR
jgi:hypothetical protein